VKHGRHHIAQVAGVEHVGQQAARDAAGGFGEESGRRQKPRRYVERHLLAFGEQAQEGCAHVGEQIGAAREDVREGAQVLGGLVDLAGAAWTQAIDEGCPQGDRVFIGMRKALKRAFHRSSAPTGC